MAISNQNSPDSLSCIRVNYLFFGFYFSLLMMVHVYHLLLMGHWTSFSTHFFVVYAVGQSAIETVLLLLCGSLLRYFFGNKGIYFVTLVAFFLLLTHFINFSLVRFMGLTFWRGLGFMFQESPRNFIELLYATNVPLFLWLIAGFVALGFLFVGMFLYIRLESWTDRTPLKLSCNTLLLSICGMTLILLGWDYFTQSYLDRTLYDQMQKTLPWNDTFLSYHKEFYALPQPLEVAYKKFENDHSNLDDHLALLQKNTEHQKRPDVYLFVVESLREDYISAENTPHLAAFKKDNISFEAAFSNANATHLSWFSLFYSRNPLFWGQIDLTKEKNGCSSLQLLKQMGYQIFVYSSTRLAFYQMHDLIFGENGQVADEIIEFDALQACDRDQQAIGALFKEMNNAERMEGRMFIVFLDSTHFDYSWPSEANAPFKPYENQINYFKAILTNHGIDSIKNRYRNSLYYIDALFGNFLSKLHASPKGDEAVVILTGDHGEEFYDHGHLFHASNLSEPQIHVPLYYKLGSRDVATLKREQFMSCHMDIFPTLFHHLTGDTRFHNVFQGQSILQQDRWPYTIIARYNASNPPSEFCIHSGKEKILAKFTDEKNIFQCNQLRILSTRNLQDQAIQEELFMVNRKFGDAIDYIFSPK